MAERRFVCPYCGRASHHFEDVVRRYCSCCGSPPLLPKDCAHRTADACPACGERLMTLAADARAADRRACTAPSCGRVWVLLDRLSDGRPVFV